MAQGLSGDFLCAGIFSQMLGQTPPTAHLLRTKVRIALTQFAGSAFDNRIAKHRYHHHEEEVTGVHEMQIY